MDTKSPPDLGTVVRTVKRHMKKRKQTASFDGLARVNLLSAGTMIAGGAAVTEGAMIWSGKGDIVSGAQHIAGAVTDPNSCHNGKTDAVACGFVQIAEQMAADALIKGGIKMAYKVTMKKAIKEMAEKAVTKASEEMAEKMAVKFGEEVVEEVVEREVTEAVIEAATETEMGPVGWALEIFQAISMVLDLGDPEGYNKMLEDNQINEMIGNMELALKNTFIVQGQKSVNHLFDTKYSVANTGLSEDEYQDLKDCFLCKFTSWPQKKYPFSTDMFDITLDPILHQKIVDYSIDYLRWQTPGSGTTEPYIDANGQPVTFEFLLAQTEFERILLPFKRNLSDLGIELVIRRVDVSQYINRLRSRDFDMIVGGFGQSNSPGNEQREYWHSSSADNPGSRNYIGLKDPAIDQLVEGLINADSRQDLINHTRALDRVLLWGYYVIPNWHIKTWRVAYWNRFEHPKVTPLYDIGLHTWWVRPGLEQPSEEQQPAAEQAEQ